MSDRIAVTFTETAVNMGDHAQDVIRNVEVGENETVQDLLERLIPGPGPGSTWRKRDYSHFVLLRFEEPYPKQEAPNETI